MAKSRSSILATWTTLCISPLVICTASPTDGIRITETDQLAARISAADTATKFFFCPGAPDIGAPGPFCVEGAP